MRMYDTLFFLACGRRYFLVACGCACFVADCDPVRSPSFPTFSMCYSSCGNKAVAQQLLRTGFGLSLVFTGIAHYRDITAFAESVSKDLGPEWLMSIGWVWGYILPALFIIGGLAFTFNLFTRLGVWAAGIGLASIPAGVMLKSAITGVSLGDTMPLALNAFLWLLVFIIAAKSTDCCDDIFGDYCDCDDCDCCDICGEDPCVCEDVPAKKPVMKSAATPKSTTKAKKPAAKKKTSAKKAASKTL